ncbi:MAG: hypothetical protein JO306_06135 [Gemmatimonadetes bacterium]|nr:hypothetical protein [Gemmatimonadota bacterium]
MDRYNAGNDQHASEDPSEAREHVRAAEENRDALEAQARRTDATTPDTVDQPVRGMDASRGTSSSGQGSEDASSARAHVSEAERNRDALEAQNRRVENTTPDEIRDDH